MSDDNFWTGFFLVFLLFVFMFLTFYNVRRISDSVYEGLMSGKGATAKDSAIS
jgi:hypothetical protein